MRTISVFKQIYQAALQRDESLLPPEGTYDIDEFRQDRYGLTAAAQLVLEGNVDAAKWLLQQGANINPISRGAAQVGYVDFTNELLQQGANINSAARGATLGGHVDFANELIKRGADINKVAEDAAAGRQVSTEQQQLSFFSKIGHQTTPHQLAKALARLITNRVQVKPTIVERANRTARLIHHFAYSYSLALASTQAVTLQASDDATTTRTNTGALVMLAGAACFQNQYPFPKGENGKKIQIALPSEICRNIFEFVFESKLSQKDLQQLGFFTGRFVLIKQLDDYRKSLWFWQKDKKANIDSLKNSALRLSNVRELRDFVSSKREDDENDNDAASTSMSTSVQTIFRDWQKRLTTNEEDTDTENSNTQIIPS